MSVSSLCLACSSSLPPRKDNFLTPCCQQPICSPCLVSNPRLARYNPCLLCLAGVDAVSSIKDNNVDGAVKDEDTFVLGDSDEDEDENANANVQDEETQTCEAAPPINVPETLPQDDVKSLLRRAQYFIKRGDTLQGIVFKFGVNVRISPSSHHISSDSLNNIRSVKSYVDSTIFH